MDTSLEALDAPHIRNADRTLFLRGMAQSGASTSIADEALLYRLFAWRPTLEKTQALTTARSAIAGETTSNIREILLSFRAAADSSREESFTVGHNLNLGPVDGGCVRCPTLKSIILAAFR
jgi:hypothetical protein